MAKDNNNIQAKNQLQVYTPDLIQSRILTIRGQQVIMDADLAEFYQVKTIALNQAVKRNIGRFPERYRFQLNEDEKNELITNCDRFRNLKHSSHLPYAFTEQGVTQLSAVLRSDIVVEMSVRINDAFHAMRRFIMNNAAIFQRMRVRPNLTATIDCYVQSRHQTQDMQFAFSTYNRQYPSEHVQLHTFQRSHDRFLIIDDELTPNRMQYQVCA